MTTVANINLCSKFCYKEDRCFIWRDFILHNSFSFSKI